MRFLKSEAYFPAIVGVHLVLWAVDLSLFDGVIPLVAGESASLRILGEVMSSWVVTVFGFNLLMTTRLPWVERIFGGLDKMYTIHRRSGMIAMVLLLLHFALVPRHPDFTIGKPMGFLAMALILLGIAFAAAPVIKRRLPYHKWLKGHRLMGPFYVVGVAHALFVPTLIAKLPLVRTYVFGMALLGVLSWIYRVAASVRGARMHGYQVTEVTRYGEDTVDLHLEAKGDPIGHLAGQFAFFSFERLSNGEAHPFTIASAPTPEGGLRIVVKCGGDFTQRLVREVAVGDRVRVEGPYGHLTLAKMTAPTQVWVAGGIGITPFLALIEAAASTGTHVDLTWSVRTASEAYFHDELMARAAAHANVAYRLWLSNTNGYLNGSLLGEVKPNSTFAICGPAALRDTIERDLVASGLKRGDVHSEEFTFR